MYFLDEKAHQQVFNYCDLINANYAIVCNGSILYCYKYIEDTDSYEELNSVPDYAEMLEGKNMMLLQESIPERMPYERMESYLKEAFAEYPDDYYGETISKSTPLILQRLHSILKKLYLILGTNFLKKTLVYLSLLRITEYEYCHMAMRVEGILVVL